MLRVLRADLPGFRKDDLDISLEDDVLTVKAERKEESANRQKHGSHDIERRR